MHSNNQQKTKRADSLVEVLVILALVAVSMTGIAGVNVRTLLQVKDNETLDTANGIMLQALEIAKSPSGVTITGTSSIGNFSINNSTNKLIQRSAGDPPLTISSSCTPSSSYYVPLNTTGNAGRYMCLQLTIVQKQRPLSTQTYYEITSRVLFNLNSGPVLNQLVGYRRGTIS